MLALLHLVVVDYYLVWVLETSPDALYILILVGMMWLWRPKTNSKQYALYEQAGTLDAGGRDSMDSSDDDEYLPDDIEDEQLFDESGIEASAEGLHHRREVHVILGPVELLGDLLGGHAAVVGSAVGHWGHGQAEEQGEAAGCSHGVTSSGQ